MPDVKLPAAAQFTHQTFQCVYPGQFVGESLFTGKRRILNAGYMSWRGSAAIATPETQSDGKKLEAALASASDFSNTLIFDIEGDAVPPNILLSDVASRSIDPITKYLTHTFEHSIDDHIDVGHWVTQNRRVYRVIWILGNQMRLEPQRPLEIGKAVLVARQFYAQLTRRPEMIRTASFVGGWTIDFIERGI